MCRGRDGDDGKIGAPGPPGEIGLVGKPGIVGPPGRTVSYSLSLSIILYFNNKTDVCSAMSISLKCFCRNSCGSFAI